MISLKSKDGNMGNLSNNINMVSHETGGEIEENSFLMEYVPKSHITKKLISIAKQGTLLLKLGKGRSKVLITAGIHGNELPPQIASLWLINELVDEKINGTVYIIPFAVPHATAKNSRKFKGFDMNRTASKGGFISNDIIKSIKSLKIDAIADFHSTKPGSNPGIESVFCSKEPCNDSFKIAKHITEQVSSRMICHEHAGTLYNGALEDESNLEGIPAITCEVVSNNGVVNSNSPERSYLQMKAYLDYFNIV